MAKQLIYGLHSVAAALHGGDARVRRIWLDAARRDSRVEALLHAAAEQGVSVQRVSQAVLERMSGTARHQGVVAEYHPPSTGTERDLQQILKNASGPVFLLVLDGVQDPHNLGACLRSAAAAGVHAVIAPRDRAVGFTPTVHKVASGGADRVSFIQVTNLARTLRALQEEGVWVVGAVGDADELIYEIDLCGPLAVVMGSEGKGLRALTRTCCDRLARIPMAGSVESLNVSVATGIVLFEAVRQRRI